LAAGAGAWLVGRAKRRWVIGLAALGAVATVVLAPLAVPADRRFLRFLSGVAAVTVSAKLYDAALDAMEDRRIRGDRGLWTQPGFWGFLVFLPNIFVLVRRKVGRIRQSTGNQDLAQLARGAVTTLVGLIFFIAVF